MRSRPFVALYVAVFVATLGISMVSPLLPVYAETLGASGVWLGITFSVFAVVQTFFGPFAGRLSDRYGRKPFIVAGLLVYLVAALGYLTAQSFYQVIAFRAFSGFGTSLIFSVARAYVGDMTPRGQEGRWLGVFATADIVGFGTGPLIAGLLRQEVGFRSVFVAMAALMALSALILLWWLPRHSPAELARGRMEKGGERPKQAPFSTALRERLVIAVTTHQFLISLAMGASFSFLALRLENGLHARPLAIGLAFATQDLTGGLAQPLFGRLADRYHRPFLVAGGLIANGLLLACVGALPNYWLVVAVLMGMGATGAISQVSASAIQVVAGRGVGMGTVLGINSAANGAGIVIGSVVGGLIFDIWGLSHSFFFAGLVMVAGAPAFLTLTRGLHTREPARTGHAEFAEAAGGQ
ncbi:MAG: MFS transporter [Dehalococcoidia bacterium]|nr:MFS transporter [Dehalococcoidia bacterium]